MRKAQQHPLVVDGEDLRARNEAVEILLAVLEVQKHLLPELLICGSRAVLLGQPLPERRLLGRQPVGKDLLLLKLFSCR